MKFCCFVAAMLLAFCQPMRASLLVVDQMGTIPVCYLATAYVNTSGVLANDPEISRRTAVESTILTRQANQTIDGPDQLRSIYNGWTGPYTTVSFPGGTARVWIIKQNVTAAAGTVVISCDPSLCTAANFPTTMCSGDPSVGLSLDEYLCAPITVSLALGQYEPLAANATSFDKADIAKAMPDMVPEGMFEFRDEGPIPRLEALEQCWKRQAAGTTTGEVLSYPAYNIGDPDFGGFSSLTRPNRFYVEGGVLVFAGSASGTLRYFYEGRCPDTIFSTRQTVNGQHRTLWLIEDCATCFEFRAFGDVSEMACRERLCKEVECMGSNVTLEACTEPIVPIPGDLFTGMLLTTPACQFCSEDVCGTYRQVCDSWSYRPYGRPTPDIITLSLAGTLQIESVYNVQLNLAVLGSLEYVYPQTFPILMAWTEFYLNVSAPQVSGFFDFVGDIASDLFGVATEDDIEDMVAAAEASLKASTEALRLISLLATEVSTLGGVLQSALDALTYLQYEQAQAIQTIEANIKLLSDVTRMNFLSTQSYTKALAQKALLSTNALWDQVFATVISGLQTDQVQFNDPFIRAIVSIIEAGISSNQTVGTSGLMSAIPMMKKQLLKTAEGSWLVYGVPVCSGLNVGLTRVTVVDGPVGGQNGGFVSGVSSGVTFLGNCVEANGTYYPTTQDYGQGAARFSVDTTLSASTAGGSLVECISSLAGSTATIIGGLQSPSGSSRSLYNTDDPSNEVWFANQSSYGIVSVGPCQYVLYSTLDLGVLYHRPSGQLLPARGRDLIMLEEGSSVTVTSQVAIPGLPVTLRCRVGEQIGAVLEGEQVGWITNGVLTGPSQDIPFPADVLIPELKYRNKTFFDMAALSEELDRTRGRTDEIAAEAEAAYHEAMEASQNLQDYINGRCDFWTLSNCSVFKQFLAVVVYSMMAAGLIYLIMLVSRMAPGKAAVGGMYMAMKPVASQILVGDDLNSTTTTTLLQSTTTVPSTTTTTEATTTTWTCSGMNDTEFGFYEEVAGVCCEMPKDRCNMFNMGDCSTTEQFAMAMYWILLAVMIIYTLRRFFLVGKRSVAGMTEMAVEAMLKSIGTSLIPDLTAPSYSLYCTSNVCKGQSQLCSVNLSKLRSPIDCEVEGIVAETSDGANLHCDKCGSCFGTPTTLYKRTKPAYLINESTGISMDSAGGIVLASTVRDKIHYRCSVIVDNEARNSGLYRPDVMPRIQGASALLTTVVATQLPRLGFGENWRRGCEPADFSSTCCTQDETRHFIVLWVIVGLLALSVITYVFGLYLIIVKGARKMRRLTLRMAARAFTSGGALVTAVGVIASAPGADASPVFNIQWIDDGDCSLSNFSNCSAGHQFVYVLVTGISAIFTIGLLLIMYRLLGCLKGLTKCLTFRSKKDEDNGKMLETAKQLFEFLGSRKQ